MIIVSFPRSKCIGCNYCVEAAPQRWVMSKKDGKSNLIGAKEKGGFFTVKLHDDELLPNQKAANACPVKIIQVREH